jgi:hypothetical protein
VRSVCARPFDAHADTVNVCVSRRALHRTYALIGRNDLRLASSIANDVA